MRSLVFLLLVASVFAQNARPESPRVRRVGQITLGSSVDKVFPLFGPVDEAKWAPGWEPSIKHGGNAETGTVFTTDGLPHRATWIVSRYDGKDHDMEYIVFFPEDRVVQLDIVCQAVSVSSTSCEIAYAITALSDAGRDAVASYTQEKHERRIAHWQMAINHYLATGARIEPHD